MLPPPPTPPAAKPAKPKPQRYDGKLEIINIDFEDKASYLYGAMFVHAPCGEPYAVSFRRLIDALRNRGETQLRPGTIWATYRYCPELAYPEDHNLTDEERTKYNRWTSPNS